MRWRLLFHLFLIQTLLLVGTAFCWRNSVRARVEAVGSVFRGYFDGKLLCTVQNGEFPQGRAGIYLRQETFGQGWDNFRVYDYHTGALLYADGFLRAPGKDWDFFPFPWTRNLWGEFTTEVPLGVTWFDYSTAVTGDLQWRDVVVEADIVRGLDAGIVVRSQGSGNGLIFNFRQKHQDAFFFPLTNGTKGANISPVITTNGWSYNLKSVAGRLLMTEAGAAAFLLAMAAAWGMLVLLFRATGPLGRGLARLGEKAKGALPKSLERYVGKGLAAGFLCVALLEGRHDAVEVLQKIPHVQDSVATLFQARILALGRLFAPAPPFASSFSFEMMVLNGDKWFSKYTLGHSLMLVPGVWLGQPWMVGPVLGALTVWLAFLLAWRLGGLRLAMVAGGLMVTSPFFFFMTGSYMAHTTCLFFVTAFHWGFVKGFKDQDSLAGLLAGLALGMAAITRPLTAVTAAFPAILWGLYQLGKVLWAWVRRKRDKGYRTGALWAHLEVYLALTLGVLPALCFQLNANAVYTGNPFTFGYAAYSGMDHLGFGEGVGWYGAHTPLNGVRNIDLNLQELLHHLFGWTPFATLAGLMIPFILLSRNHWDYYFLFAFLAQVGGYFLWWYHGIVYGPRFWYEALFPMVYLTGRGVEGAASLARHVWGRGSRRVAFALAALPLVFLGWGSVKVYIPRKISTDYLAYNYTSPILLQQVQQYDLHNVVVFVKSGLFWSVYGSVFGFNEPLLDGDVVYAQDCGEATNQALMRYIYEGREAYFYDNARLYQGVVSK